MSYIMHNKRLNCLTFIKRYLKEKKKVSKKQLKLEIMMRFNFSGYTAERYINDIVAMGIARLNDNHVIYKEKEGGKPNE